MDKVTRNERLERHMRQHGARGEQLRRGLAIANGARTVGEVTGESWNDTAARLRAEFEATKS